jgi:enoyl-CoA hydratase
MKKVLYEKDGRIGRITLNRPEVMNAIDDDLPAALASAVAEADADPNVHVMVLAGNGPAFCAGYDLHYYAEQQGGHKINQNMPWIPSRTMHSCGATLSISCLCGVL